MLPWKMSQFVIWRPWAVCWWKTFPDPDRLTGLSHHQSVWRRRLWTLIELTLPSGQCQWHCHWVMHLTSWFFRRFCKQPIQRVDFEGFKWLRCYYGFVNFVLILYWFNMNFICFCLVIWLFRHPRRFLTNAASQLWRPPAWALSACYVSTWTLDFCEDILEQSQGGVSGGDPYITWKCDLKSKGNMNSESKRNGEINRKLAKSLTLTKRWRLKCWKTALRHLPSFCLFHS